MERGENRERFGNRYWKGRLLLVFWEGLGDALLSIPSITLVRNYYENATIGVSVWNNSQQEIFNELPLGIETVRFPDAILGRELRSNKGNIFRLPINLLTTAKIIMNYDVVASIASGKSFELLKQAFAAFESLKPQGAGKLPLFLPFPHVTRLSGREEYMGTTLLKQVSEMLGCGDVSFLDSTLEIKDYYKDSAVNFFKKSFPESSKIVVLNLRTGHKNKDLPMEKFSDLGRRLIDNLDVYLLAVNFTNDQADKLESLFGQRVRFFKNPSILLTAAIIKQADLYIGGDTGLSHLSYMTGTPSIIFFGPTLPQTWLPPDRKVFSVRAIEVAPFCRDYECRTRFQCNQKTVTCLNSIPVEGFVNFAEEFLKINKE